MFPTFFNIISIDEQCRMAGTFFQPLVLERSGGMSKTTAKIIKKLAMLAGHRMGSDPYVSGQEVLQKLSIKVQVLNAKLVAMCIPYGDAYHTRSASRNAGAVVQRPAVCGTCRWEATHGQWLETCKQ
jgi:hypothetical protein